MCEKCPHVFCVNIFQTFQQKQGPFERSMLNKHVHLVEEFLQVLSSCSRSAPPLSLKFSEACSVIVCYLWWDVPLEVRMNGEDTAPENRRLGPRKRQTLSPLPLNFRSFRC